MQIGIGGASGNNWGGAPVHPASEQVAGVATDGNGDGIASVYEPADAIAGAAKYLVAHGAQNNVSGAIFAYNHLSSYVQSCSTGRTSTPTVASRSPPPPPARSPPPSAWPADTAGGGPGSAQVPNQAVATAIAFARSQIGKPYLWGGTGPDAFDCSGLMMMAYRAAGVNIPRTSEDQWPGGRRSRPATRNPAISSSSPDPTAPPPHRGTWGW